MNFSIGRRRDRWMLLIGGVLVGLAAVAGVLALSHKPDFRGACVAPKTVDALGPRIYDNHKTIKVSPGTIVTVELLTGASEIWPWRTPRSSD